MSVNLVSLVSEFLTPDLISRISTALGLDRSSCRPSCRRLRARDLGKSFACCLDVGGGAQARQHRQPTKPEHPRHLGVHDRRRGSADIGEGRHKCAWHAARWFCRVGASWRCGQADWHPSRARLLINRHTDSSRAWPAWRAASSARPRCVRFGTASGCTERQYCRSFTIRIWGNASRIRGTGVRNC